MYGFLKRQACPRTGAPRVVLVMVGTRHDGTLMWDLGKPGPGTFDPDFPCPPYCPPG